MKTAKKTMITLLAAIMLMSVAAFAFAKQGHKDTGCFSAGPDSKQWASLSPEKQAKVQSILDNHYSSMRNLRTQFWEKHTTLDALVNSGNAKKEDIESLTAELGALKKKIFAEREGAAQEIEKISGLKLLQAKHCTRGGKGHGKAGHSGGCPATTSTPCAN